MADVADTRGSEDAAEQVPPYVVTDADRERWDNAGTVARKAHGPDATADELWAARRVIYHDREAFPD